MSDYTIKQIIDFPEISALKRNWQGYALLDALVMPDWEFRYFSFDAHWDTDETMGSLRDGGGSEVFILFCSQGVVGKVLQNGSIEESESLIKHVPDCFNDFKNEPAFRLDEASYLFWKESEKEQAFSIASEDEQFTLLKFFLSDFEGYVDWAEEYYEREIDRNIARQIFDSLSVSDTQMNIINPELNPDNISEDIKSILG